MKEQTQTIKSLDVTVVKKADGWHVDFHGIDYNNVIVPYSYATELRDRKLGSRLPEDYNMTIAEVVAHRAYAIREKQLWQDLNTGNKAFELISEGIKNDNPEALAEAGKLRAELEKNQKRTMTM